MCLFSKECSQGQSVFNIEVVWVVQCGLECKSDINKILSKHVHSSVVVGNRSKHILCLELGKDSRETPGIKTCTFQCSC